MTDDPDSPAENSDAEFERRIAEIQEKTRQIAHKASAPEPPKLPDTPVKILEPKRASMPPPMARGMGLAFAIGYSFIGPVLAGIIIGSLLDGHAGGLWTIVGILLGTVCAFVLLIRLVNRLNDS